MKKTCSKCFVEKDEINFYKKTKTARQSYCKDCFNLYCVERWKNKKSFYIKKMGDCCQDCHGKYDDIVYDFHHTGKKEFEWDKLRKLKKETIENELKNCILLCSNCHRLRHKVTL